MTPNIEATVVFAQRPCLHQVALHSLREALVAAFPDLSLDPEIAVITRTASTGAARAETLLANLQRVFSSARTPRWRADAHTLVADPAATPPGVIDIDLEQLSIVFDSVALALRENYMAALTAFWAKPQADGTSPWQWLSQALKQQMLKDSDASSAVVISDAQREVIQTIGQFGDRNQRDFMLRIPMPEGRNAIRACIAYASTSPENQGDPASALAVIGVWQGEEVFLTWQPAHRVVSHASLAQMETHLGGTARSLHWTMDEPDGDIFGRLAQVILENQLREVSQTPLAGFDEMERAVAAATDVSRLFAFATEGISHLSQLPGWLHDASVADRLAYSRHLAALAVAQAQAPGRAFNDDLPPMLEFARAALQHKLNEAHPEASDLPMAGLEVVIHKVVGVAVPSGGQMLALGSVEPMRLSAAAFALENLSSLPSGRISIERTDGQPIPDWLTADFLKLLVCQVDVGRTYPERVERYLLTDKVEAARREALFAEQLRVQLPLKALEHKLRGQGHLDDPGYRMVCAMMLPTGQRAAGLRNVVVRPLAFVSSPGAPADQVINAFVIGNRDTGIGPFVLYRPFAQIPLSEFPSWAALRDAIAEAGALQNEVLGWMSDHSRARYGNGGFDEPHTLRFGQGSDFSALQIPPPAQLALEEVQGDLLNALFVANAEALVKLADRDSVSNAESRWALLKQGGWLALDAVMPFISGPAGGALWLTQLMISVNHALLTDLNGDLQSRAAAFNELLLTISLVLLHQGVCPPATAGESARQSSAFARSRPIATRGSGATSTVFPGPLLDFSWSSQRNTLTDHQAAALDRLKGMPIPDLPAPSSDPATQGLYSYAGQWYARLDQGVFPVQLAESDVFVADPAQADQNGPRLVFSGGAWRLDLSLRLRGGAPKRNARLIAQENAATLKRVIQQRSAFWLREKALYVRIAEHDRTLRAQSFDQHDEVMAAIDADLRELVTVVQARHALDAELRPADRLDVKVVARDIQNVTQRISFYEAALLSDMLDLSSTEVARMRGDGKSVVSPENIEAYLALFRKVLRMQDSGEYWSAARETLWQRLREVPKVGEQFWRGEVLELTENNMFTHLEWQIGRMWSLLELCFDRNSIVHNEANKPLKALRVDDSLHAAFTSQAALDKPNDCSLTEQIRVLESSLREYDRVSMVAISVHETDPQALQLEYFKGFLEGLSAISDAAEQRLGALIRQTQEPPQTPQDYVPRVKQPNQRVFKTRAQRTLVGRLRAGEPELHGDVVEVKDAVSDKVIAAYHQHGEGDWVEVEARRPVSVVKEHSLGRGELTARARTLLERVDADIANARRQARRANEPEDMEDILVHKAEKLNELGDQFEAFVQDAEPGEAVVAPLEATLAELRAAAVRLIAEGRNLRISMIKEQPPTAGRVSYLQRQGEANIASFDGRKNMSGSRRNDFLQEYVIRDKDSRVLWWAHFHYATEDAHPAAFTAAHLKTSEQRFVGYKAQLQAARDNKEVVSIYRSAIGKELAQRLFLSLTPEAATGE